MRLEDKLGSIEQGKFANLTILEENPLKVDPLHIKDIGVVATMLKGKVYPIN
jgi:predicted amidohydrolase YtcJ